MGRVQSVLGESMLKEHLGHSVKGGGVFREDFQRFNQIARLAPVSVARVLYHASLGGKLTI